MTEVARTAGRGACIRRGQKGGEGCVFVEPQSLFRQRQRVSWTGTSSVDFLSTELCLPTSSLPFEWLFDCLIDIEFVLN